MFWLTVTAMIMYTDPEEMQMTTPEKRLVILGAGTGGTLAANRLRKKFPTSELAIDIVDGDNVHVYQQASSSCRSGSPSPTRSSAPEASNCTAASIIT